jgi:DNA polymerase III gamma/tau subunit
MTLWKEIVGHDWAVGILSSAIIHERLVHAYLISGPSQVGKSTIA